MGILSFGSFIRLSIFGDALLFGGGLFGIWWGVSAFYGLFRCVFVGSLLGGGRLTPRLLGGGGGDGVGGLEFFALGGRYFLLCHKMILAMGIRIAMRVQGRVSAKPALTSLLVRAVVVA